jgi:hypothetical protein
MVQFRQPHELDLEPLQLVACDGTRRHRARRGMQSLIVLSANCAFSESRSVISDVRSEESRQGASRKLPRRGYLGDRR